MKFTIIIPCLNAEKQLHKTLDSLLGQTCRDYECLIIDGGSSDATANLVANYQVSIPTLHFYSAPDKGIYDAMNKGVSLASGEYILFLGAGDSLHNAKVLDTVQTHLETNTPDILYGNVLLLPNTFSEQPKHLTNRFFYSGKMLCHQSIFAKKSTLIEYPFSLEYVYGADKDWLLYCFHSNKIFSYLPITVSTYDTNGFSSRPEHRKALWMESGKILRKYYGFLMQPITILKYYLFIKWH